MNKLKDWPSSGWTDLRPPYPEVIYKGLKCCTFKEAARERNLKNTQKIDNSTMKLNEIA